MLPKMKWWCPRRTVLLVFRWPKAISVSRANTDGLAPGDISIISTKVNYCVSNEIQTIHLRSTCNKIQQNNKISKIWKLRPSSKMLPTSPRQSLVFFRVNFVIEKRQRREKGPAVANCANIALGKVATAVRLLDMSHPNPASALHARQRSFQAMKPLRRWWVLMKTLFYFAQVAEGITFLIHGGSFDSWVGRIDSIFFLPLDDKIPLPIWPYTIEPENHGSTGFLFACSHICLFCSETDLVRESIKSSLHLRLSW